MGKLLNLEPVRNANNIFALRKLYDDIEIQIRSLKSLNVTSGTYGTLLTPVLLKLIPNELNLDFQRKRKSKDNFDVNELLEFLKTEIECRESMLQIQDKINNHNSSHFPKEKRINKISIPTAAVLKVSINSCIFCEDSEKEKHTSEACPKSVTDRKASLRKLGMCYLCLKRGNHLAKNCFSKIKCDSCGWKHNSLICDRNSLDEKKSNKKDLNLTNKSCLEKVLLQTLVVRVRGNGPEKYCRCLIDSGSQRSYVSKFLANAMQYECINESSVIHSLFGGTEVVETHKQFVVRLSSIKNDYQCNFKAFDQANICSDIPQLNIKPYLNELKTHNIFLNDVEGRHKKLLFEHSPSEIHILIGADIAGKLLTGKIKKLECGLVCIETYLGWSIMGKIPVEMENKYDCSYAFSMLVSDSKISDLWKLDTLGILDPSESQTKRELEKQTMTHFLSNVKRDEEGRFQVCLPWIENRSLLPNYREIAEKRD
ncbi:uncharacterized protein LOC118182822 [Stegodyphus dumicola]|uniref:uncharacterized protein LOC118182822 n=1 Tax=Stegodyphus dumicola TaxID=202533 RepID=UPI0015AD15F0|nr:uncharacterized protein LOC118182822 [Stegodyphus dumicola]